MALNIEKFIYFNDFLNNITIKCYVILQAKIKTNYVEDVNHRR